MRKAIFLDRDGTINKEVDVISNPEQLELIPRAGEAIKELNDLGYLTIIVTNQAVIARGLIDEQGLEPIHAKLRNMLREHGASIDAIYFCPHHPNANAEAYRKECACRKPATGMIDEAVKKFDIDITKSFLVGDHTRDILAGKNAGLVTIAVETGYGAKDGKHLVEPDFVAKDLMEAVTIIKQHAQ